MNRYSNKRRKGPTHRGFTIREEGYEGRIPVLVSHKLRHYVEDFTSCVHVSVAAFYRHPTKGWRSIGPEGRR